MKYPKCPLCEKEILIYEKYKDTHIWSCGDCSMVCFEYYSKKNTTELNEKLEQSQ